MKECLCLLSTCSIRGQSNVQQLFILLQAYLMTDQTTDSTLLVYLSSLTSIPHCISGSEEVQIWKFQILLFLIGVQILYAN